MLKYLLKCIGFLKILKTRINNKILSFIPSHIKSCYLISTNSSYKISKYIKLCDDYNYNKYYLFNIWNRQKLSTEYIYINEQILYNICNEYYINIKKYTTTLNNYINNMCKKYKDDIFHIEINNKDAMKDIYKYKKSFLIPLNVNAISLYLLNNILDNNKNNENIKHIKVKIMDYNLEEKLFYNNEFITVQDDVNTLV